METIFQTFHSHKMFYCVKFRTFKYCPIIYINFPANGEIEFKGNTLQQNSR